MASMCQSQARLGSAASPHGRLPDVHANPLRVRDIAAHRTRGAAARADTDGPSTSYAAPARSRGVAAGRRHRLCVVVAAAPSAAVQDKVGVVIVDHGSRKKDSNEMLVEFGRLYGQLTGQEIVEIAHMEIARPTIEEAVGRCAARGARRVVVAPYFLSRGRHIQEDIPALVREAQQKHPGLECIIAGPIGIDALMVQLISNRVASALEARGDAGDADHGDAGDVSASPAAVPAAME